MNWTDYLVPIIAFLTGGLLAYTVADVIHDRTATAIGQVAAVKTIAEMERYKRRRRRLWMRRLRR